MYKFILQFKSIALAIFLTLVIILSSCSDDKPTDNSKDIIKIGALIPITGSGSSTGESMLEAIKLAVEDYNGSLVNSPKAELHYFDTETSPQKALEILQNFKNMGITFVVGPYSSAELEFIKSYANENNMILISPSSVSMSLAIKDDNVFRIATNDYHQVSAISKYFNSKNLNKICAVNRDDVWGNSLYDEILKKSSNMNYELTEHITYNTNSAEFTQLSDDIENHISTLLNSNNEGDIAVYLATFNEGTDILSKSSNMENSGKVKWIGTSAYALNSTLLTNNTAFDFAVKSDFICPVYAPDEDSSPKLTLVKEYLRTSLEREPESYSYTAYDAVNIAINAAHSVKINTLQKPTDAVIQYCNSSAGITGQLELDEFGDRKYGNYDFWQVRKVNSKNEWFKKYKYILKTDELIEIN
jgi:branched-chain amino acid transport system substrate-binding protein